MTQYKIREKKKRTLAHEIINAAFKTDSISAAAYFTLPNFRTNFRKTDKLVFKPFVNAKSFKLSKTFSNPNDKVERYKFQQ